MHVNIIGAGPGGLSAAIALKQKGISIRVYEQAKSLKEVGAGVVLGGNAMQVFDRLSLREEISAHGVALASMNITKADLTPLSSLDMSPIESRFGVQNIAIHRGKLQALLADRLEPDELELDHRLERVDHETNGCTLTFEGGNTVFSPLTIAADGIHSIARNALDEPGTIRSADQLCWRGVADYTLPNRLKNKLNEAWGPTGRFGIVPIGESTVYWFAVKTMEPGEALSADAAIHSVFQDFHPLIGELIQATDKEHIHTAELSDLLPIKHWHKGTLCLIGDAAHATTPNMGQGAGQAIEDAYVLAACLAKHRSQQAFGEFQRIRAEKVKSIVEGSWRLGKMAHWSHPISASLRNCLMRLTPTSLMEKNSIKIYQLPQL